MATYVSELCAIAQWCNFGESLENMLRDRLVVGIDNEAIQCRLLSESTLTFKKALELAQSLEAAAKNMKEIQNSANARAENPRTESVGKVAWTNACHRCGKVGHFVHSRMRNVIIAGKWVTSKRPVTTSWTLGVA